MKKKICISLNIFIGIMSFASWIYMTFFSKSGSELASNGWESLKYFTVLSNLLNGFVCLLYSYKTLHHSESVMLKKLKLVATSCIGLTFVTVFVFLGPLFGYDKMFQGANFWMHLILPILSFISFIVLERGIHLSFQNTYLIFIPVGIYEIVYLTNNLVNGIGVWPDTNDFYGFLTWGYGIGLLIAVIILFATWMISVILGKLGKVF